MITDFHRVAPRLYVGGFPGGGAELRAEAQRIGFARVIRCAWEFPREFEYPLDDGKLTPEQIALFEAGVAAPRDTDLQEGALGAELSIREGLKELRRGDLVALGKPCSLRGGLAALVLAG